MPLQDFIHKVTEGSGSRLLTVLLVFFGMVGLAVWYDLAAFRNLSTIEGMDQAQLARNLSEGRGFVTQFVRPFSLYLVRRHRADQDPLLSGQHPDLANAPLYPALLAGVLKVMPFAYPDLSDSDAPAAKRFSVYQPDLWIAGFNQLLFFIAVWLLFRLARRLLDETAAWLSVAVFAGSEFYWRFTLGGLPTQLLMVLFLALAETLTRIEPQTREGATRGAGWLVGMAALAGALAGLAALTRYSFGLIIIPVLVFLAGLASPRRSLMLAGCVAAFVVTLGPWLVRNWMVCGAPFGTAGYAALEGTSLFPGFDLPRSLNPDFSLMGGGELWHKLMIGLREILEKDLPKLGGSWVTGFFLSGLLVPFRSPTLNRLRGFVVGSVVLLALVQAAGRTGLTTDSPEVNSENLLAIVAPLVFVFGVSLFLMLLGQFGLQMPAFRFYAMGLFVALAGGPLLFALFMPVRSPLAYPPYYPPYIQEKAHWVGEKDLIMSDLPWAVAWYGQRQSVWLSLKYREEVTPKYRNDFYVLNRLSKPIRALYLTSRTLKTIEVQSLAPWLRSANPQNWEESVSDWESFAVLGVYLKHEIPTGFPLKQAPFGLYPELFLAHSERNQEKTIKGE